MHWARSIVAAAGNLALDIEALLLPVACLGCERPVRGEGRVLCEACRLELRPVGAPRCARCGGTLDSWEHRGGANPGAGCGFCREWPPALSWAASAVWLDDGPARRLAHALKYEGWRCAASEMAEQIARCCKDRFAPGDVLVPIPLGATRLRERGHNQAEAIAVALARRLPAPVTVSASLLSRARETRTQTDLGPRERSTNVWGAFATTGNVEGRRLVLVDDVLTTGATLAAGAAALGEAGARELGAVTFARAAKPA